MKIVIVGDGLGGLTSAITFAQKHHNHEVKVIERKSSIWTVGGAISLQASILSIFADLGILDRINAVSDITELAHQRELVSGKLLRIMPIARSRALWSRKILRGTLMDLLYDEAMKLGVSFEFSSTVVDLDETTTGVSVSLDNGTTEEADLVLAADGVRSRLRAKILSPFVSDLSQLEPIYSNRTYYIVKLSIEEQQSLRVLGADVLFTPNFLAFWAGQGRYVISLHNYASQDLNFVFCVREPTDMDTLFDEKGDIAYVRSKFAGSYPELERALSVARKCERWQLSQIPPLPRWRSQQGRLAVIGDAAHSMHPTAGRGYASTVEEMTVLAYVLDRASSVGEATQMWEEICKPRSKRLQELSLFYSAQYEDDQDARSRAALGAAREVELRKTDPDMEGVKSDMNADFGQPEFTVYMLRYDALKEAKEYLEKHDANGMHHAA